MTRDGWSRRRVLRAAAGAGTAAALSGRVAAQGGGDYDGWLADVDNYDGTTVDATGQSSVTVEVGADGNGGTFAYAPPAVRVDPGTEISFEWVSNTHNVVIEEQPDGADWEGITQIYDEGHTETATLETEGVYKYYCEPHLSVGMKGVVVVGGGSGGGGGDGGPIVPAEYGDWFADVGNYDGTTVDRTGQSSVTVEVGADGNGGTFAYAPPAVRVDPGTEIAFEWVSDTHNVVVEDQPDGADWQGIAEIHDEGYSATATLETPGVYTYYCEPHLSVGMKGAVVVGSAPGAGSGGGGPSTELTALEHLILRGGIGLGLAAPLLFAVAGRFLDARGTEPAPAVEAPTADPEHPVDHDEFDPTGTWTLVLVYLAILLVMWVFVYFVEFLGRGPTVIG